jgi:Zn-dependent protease with chaperone function
MHTLGIRSMQNTETRRALIERLDAQARTAPARYLRHVLALALLGLAVIALGLTMSLGVSVGLIVALAAIKPSLLFTLAKLVWIPIATGWMLLRALWVRFEVPEGRRLEAGEAPALVAEVERLRARSDAPALDGIIIDDAMNAGAAAVPRAMGLLGNRLYLVLGLPLMQALGPEEFAAVVAHEFGHFSGRHGRIQGWIYQARSSWYRILDGLRQKQSRLLGAFVRFFDWYVPYFEAYSFVLARRQEFEADATAARLVGARPLATALTRIELNAQRLANDFWPAIDRAIATEAEPPADVQARLAAALRRQDPEAAARLQAALSRAPGLDDTHPPLAHRIRSVGGDAGLPGPLAESAADALLGPLLPELQAHFSAQWREAVAPHWTQRHGEGRGEAERVAELGAKGALSDDEEAELALLRWSLEPGEAAGRALREASLRCPDNAALGFRVGEAMLAKDEAGAADVLWRALALDRTLASPVLELLGSYYADRGDDAGLDRVNEAWADERKRQQRSQQARSSAYASDTLEQHGLSPSALEAARAAFRAHGNVKKAWIVRKVLPPELGATPHYLVLFAWRGLMFSQQKGLRRLVDLLDLPGSYLAITADGHRNVARRVRKVAGAPTYRHGEP